MRGRDWSQTDIQECLRRDLTVAQIAARLHRTPKAVHDARYRARSVPQRPISLDEHDAQISRCSCGTWVYGRQMCGTCHPLGFRRAS